MRTRRRAAALLAIALVVLVAAGWALGRLAVAAVGGLDLTLVRDAVADRTAALTAVAHAISFIGSGFVLFPLAAVLALGLTRARRFADAAVVALGTLGGVVISNVDKVLVDRPRPPVRHLEHVVTASFPSGHATQSSAFSVAVLLVVLAAWPAAETRTRRAACSLTAAIVLAVAASRVYLGVHYPSDVVAGMVLGSVWSGLVGRRLFAPASYTVGSSAAAAASRAAERSSTVGR